MKKSKTLRIYQVFDFGDPSGTDTYTRTHREADKIRKRFDFPSDVYPRDIHMNKAGIIDLLNTLPRRG